MEETVKMARKKILLVEDDTLVRDLYEHVLKGADFEVTSAVDGEAAIAKAAHGKYDLVLLDIMLPKLTGMEVLKQFREPTSPMKDTPVYLLTNLGEETISTEAYKLGANGYLLKAKYLPPDLVNEINKFFINSAAGDTNFKTIPTSDDEITSPQAI